MTALLRGELLQTVAVPITDVDDEPDKLIILCWTREAKLGQQFNSKELLAKIAEPCVAAAGTGAARRGSLRVKSKAVGNTGRQVCISGVDGDTAGKRYL